MRDIELIFAAEVSGVARLPERRAKKIKKSACQ